MKVRVTRIEKDLPLPEYKTDGAVAFDFYSRKSATINPSEGAFLGTNLIVEVPEGYALILASRSSLGPKKGLVLRNGIGVIDRDYHGPEDEIKLYVYNFTSQPVEIEKGERLCQGILVPVAQAKWEEVDSIKSESRGGFGSTGSK